MRTTAQAWTVLLAFAFPAAARAQDSDPDSIPVRREYIDAPLEIPHDPFGLGLKNSAYSVGLRIAEVFDDNIFLTDGGEEEDLITVFLLSAEGTYRSNESDIRVAYHGRERIYADNDDLSGMEHFLDVGGTFRTTSLYVGAGVELRDRKDTFDPLEIREPVDSTFARGYATVGTDFNKFDVSLTADLAQFAIDDDFHDRGNYERVGLALLGAARVGTEAEAFGEILLRSTDYDENVFSDFTYLRIAGGVRGRFGPTLSGEARLGYGQTEADSEGALDSDDFAGLVAEAIGVWRFAEKHEVLAGLSYGPAESVVTGLSVHQSVMAGWRFTLDDSWTFRTSLRWSREEDPDGGLERTGVQYRAGARWKSTGPLYGDLGLLLRAATSDDPTLEYENLRVSIGMGVEW
jgi:hypothetical protein